MRTPTRVVRGRHPSIAAVAALVFALLVATAGCSSSDGDGAAATSVTVPDTIPVHVGARTMLDGFEEVTITVTAEDGTTKDYCLLLAATSGNQQRGLMYVTDLALGGYDGMLFLFDRDSSGGFWMKNTRLPLSIAYLADDGSIVSTTDMAPCPDTEEHCPSYPAGGPYRMAIEVVQGRLDDLGIEGGARVAVGPRSCPPLGS